MPSGGKSLLLKAGCPGSDQHCLMFFITHDLDDGIKYSLMKFAHDTKLKGKQTLGRESHPAGIDLDRLKEPLG